MWILGFILAALAVFVALVLSIQRSTEDDQWLA